MISTADRLNEAIFVAYERNSVGFCFDPTRHTIIFFDGENDVTLLEQLNSVHYRVEEVIIP